MTRGRHRRHFCHLDASVSGTGGIAFPLCNQVKGQPSLCCPARDAGALATRDLLFKQIAKGLSDLWGQICQRERTGSVWVDHTPDPVVHIAGGALYRKELFGVTKTGECLAIREHGCG